MNRFFDNGRLLQGLLWVLLLGFLFRLTTSGRISQEARYLDEFWRRYSVHAVPIPDQMVFAGEKVPLEDLEVRERVDRELLVNTYYQSATLLSMKRAARWFPVIEPILKQYGVPSDFMYLAVIESGLSNAVSPAGAAGFWQFIESTGTSYGLRIEEGIDERYDPIRSTHAACRFLLDAKREFGSWAMAAAAYNMGTNGLRRQVQQQGLGNYYELWLNQETCRYLPRMIACKYIFEYPASYGYRLSPSQVYGQWPTKTIQIDSALRDLPAFARSMGLNYKSLRACNPWIRAYALPAPAIGKPYMFRIPDSEDDASLPELAGMADVRAADSLYSPGAAHANPFGQPVPKGASSASVQRDSTHSPHQPQGTNGINPTEAGSMKGNTTKRKQTVRHTVTKKQEIQDIARMFGVSVTDLLQWNNLEQTKLKEGQILKIELYYNTLQEEDGK